MQALLLPFESKKPSHLTARFNAEVLKSMWLWILIMTNKHSWPNWDPRKSPDNRGLDNWGSTVHTFTTETLSSMSHLHTKILCSLLAPLFIHQQFLQYTNVCRVPTSLLYKLQTLSAFRFYFPMCKLKPKLTTEEKSRTLSVHYSDFHNAEVSHEGKPQYQ